MSVGGEESMNPLDTSPPSPCKRTRAALESTGTLFDKFFF